MAESRKLYTIKADEDGEIKTSEEVVSIIAGLAATEVDGVSSLAGNIGNVLVSKIGMKSLKQGIQVDIEDGEVKINAVLNITYGYDIPDTSAKVQERIKSTVETMTGLKVSVVNVRITGVDMAGNC